MAFSIGILIYVIGGGIVKGDLPIVMAAVKLERPYILEWGAIVGFIYSLWRYWMACPDLGAKLHIDFHMAIYHSKFRLKTAAQYKNTSTEAKYQNSHPYIRKEGFRYYFDFSRSLGPTGGSTGCADTRKMEIDPFIAFLITASSIWGVLVKQHTFSDYILPYILALTAFIGLVIRFTTH